MKNIVLSILLSFVFTGFIAPAVSSAVTVHIDYSAVPDQEQWAKDAQKLVQDWYPRMNNMMLTKGFDVPSDVYLEFVDDNKGIAETRGNRIRVHCDWIKKHPEDIGLVFHEMIHVLQQYGRVKETWMMEGLTDYYRWAIYEGKPLSWFPVVPKEDGYKSGYQITGGLLLWLESDKAPGIVNKLNQAYHRRTFELSLFEKETGIPLDKLWAEYMQVRKEMKENAKQA